MTTPALAVSSATLLRLMCAVREAGGNLSRDRIGVRWHLPPLLAEDTDRLHRVASRQGAHLAALLETEAALLRLQRNGITWQRTGEGWLISVPRPDGTETSLALERRAGERTCPQAVALMDALEAGAPVVWCASCPTGPAS
jgi:hypothetical protein